MLCRALLFSTVVDTSLLQGYPLDCQDSEELGKNTSNGETIRVCEAESVSISMMN